MVWMSGWVTEKSLGSEVRWEASNDGRTQYSNKQNATSGNLQLCKVGWNLKIQTCRFEPHPGIKRMPSAGKTNQTTIQCFFCGLFSWLFHPFLCLYIFSAHFLFTLSCLHVVQINLWVNTNHALSGYALREAPV